MCRKFLYLLLNTILFHLLCIAGASFLALCLEHLKLFAGQGERKILGKHGRSYKLLSVYGINNSLQSFQHK